jgi:hypothetical protein
MKWFIEIIKITMVDVVDRENIGIALLQMHSALNTSQT